MAKVELYTGEQGVYLLEQGEGISAWNRRVNETDVKIIVPVQAVVFKGMVDELEQEKGKFLMYDIEPKENW